VLAGEEEAEVSNVVCLGKLAGLGELRHTVVAGQDDRSVKVLVPAGAELVEDANDEDPWRFLAERMEILGVALDKDARGLVLNDSDHVLLVVSTQEVTERSTSLEDAGQRLVILQSLPELLKVDVFHSQTGHDLCKGDIQVLAHVVLERCEEGKRRAGSLGHIETPLRGVSSVLCTDLAMQLLHELVRSGSLLASMETCCKGSCRLNLLLRRCLLGDDLGNSSGQGLDGRVRLLLALVKQSKFPHVRKGRFVAVTMFARRIGELLLGHAESTVEMLRLEVGRRVRLHLAHIERRQRLLQISRLCSCSCGLC
jgi:hypothetical protein